MNRRDVLVVVPWLDADLLLATVDSMCADLAACAYPVDNRGPDATVARAWNLGRDRVLDSGRSWLTLCSTTIRFGPSHGADWLAALDEADGGIVSAIDGGWHLTAIHADVLDHVGRFDSFDRAYCEDSDYIYRHRLSGLGDLWAGEGAAHVPVEFTTLGDAHSIVRGLADPDTPARAVQAYRGKWGGPPSGEVFTVPFGRGDRDWRWTSADERAARGTCRRAGW